MATYSSNETISLVGSVGMTGGAGTLTYTVPSGQFFVVAFIGVTAEAGSTGSLIINGNTQVNNLGFQYTSGTYGPGTQIQVQLISTGQAHIYGTLFKNSP